MSYELTTANVEVLLLIAALAFVCELVDASVGMGYGTTLTPLLLLAGLSPLEAVPAVLLSESVAGVAAGAWHHRLRNVHFTLRPPNPETRTVLVLVGFGAFGALGAVLLAFELPALIVRVYIGGMVATTGLFILLFKDQLPPLRRWRLVVVALVAAFNKAIAGGGYGPVVTGGQILSGRDPRASVAVSAIAESAVSITALGVYLLLSERIAWALAVPLLAGALLSTPLSALAVRRVGTRALRRIIGIVMVAIGLATLFGLA